MSDPKAVLDFAKKNNAQLLDLRFTDLPGLWRDTILIERRSDRVGL